MQTDSERALVKCGSWLHIGFIGITAVAVGLILLLDGEPKWLPALALVVSGGILAAVSWYRSRAVLDSAEQAPSVAKDAQRLALPARDRVASGQ